MRERDAAHQMYFANSQRAIIVERILIYYRNIIVVRIIIIIIALTKHAANRGRMTSVIVLCDAYIRMGVPQHNIYLFLSIFVWLYVRTFMVPGGIVRAHGRMGQAHPDCRRKQHFFFFFVRNHVAVCSHPRDDARSSERNKNKKNRVLRSR